MCFGMNAAISMRMSDRTRVRPMDLSCLSGFGIDLVKGERLIRARRVVIEECLTRGVGKKDSLKHHASKLLCDLWSAGALQRDGKQQTARTIELVIKSLLQHAAVPTVDWKKVAEESVHNHDTSQDSSNRERSRSRRPPSRGSLLPRRRATPTSQVIGRSRAQSLQPTMARSKSKSMPPARLALLNTEQKQSLDTSGQMLVTPLSQMVPAEDPPALDMLPRRLFQDLPATSPNDVEHYVQQSALLAGSSQKVPVAISYS